VSKKAAGKKDSKQLLYEREKRLMDAIRLGVPDRVPINCPMGYFPARVAGIPCSAAYYDFEAWYNAYNKILPDYTADYIFIQPFTPGKALEYLDPHQMRWPGFNVNPDHSHQSEEIDNMREDEYDAFVDDPSDYMFRIHMSRTSPRMSGLATLPKLSDLHSQMGLQAMAMAITAPEADRAFKTLQKAGREFRKWQPQMKKFNRMLLDYGYGQLYQGAAMPPYDIISHSMRGMRGTMLDMYRHPDKLQAACEKILEMSLARPLPPPSPQGHIRFFMTNTRGSDDFLSKKMFDTFYWPTFKRLVQGLIDKGVIPCIFFEGNFTSRLEYLLEFPKGSIVARLDTTDIFKAKKILKGHTCIEGNVPSTLLQVGTVQEVKDYCKKLIDVVGKDGGFILSPRSSTDEVSPANLKAMIDFTQEYGVYR
jgi:hypothetical protein